MASPAEKVDEAFSKGCQADVHIKSLFSFFCSHKPHVSCLMYLATPFTCTGALYYFARLPPAFEDDVMANEWLVREFGVCLVSGSSCYARGELCKWNAIYSCDIAHLTAHLASLKLANAHAPSPAFLLQGTCGSLSAICHQKKCQRPVVGSELVWKKWWRSHRLRALGHEVVSLLAVYIRKWCCELLSCLSCVDEK